MPAKTVRTIRMPRTIRGSTPIRCAMPLATPPIHRSRPRWIAVAADPVEEILRLAAAAGGDAPGACRVPGRPACARRMAPRGAASGRSGSAARSPAGPRVPVGSCARRRVPAGGDCSGTCRVVPAGAGRRGSGPHRGAGVVRVHTSILPFARSGSTGEDPERPLSGPRFGRKRPRETPVRVWIDA